MAKAVWTTLAGLVALAGMTSAAVGAGDAQGPAAQENGGAAVHGQHHGWLHGLGRWITPEQRAAERDRFVNALGAVKERFKGIHEGIRADVKAGQGRMQAFQAHAGELKAAVDDRLQTSIAHRQALLDLAKSHIDDAAAKVCEKRMQRTQDRQGGRDQKGAGRRPFGRAHQRTEGGGQN